MSLISLLNKHCPKYETTIPSTKNKIWFRPFLVKEEKKLLIVQEFGTEKEIINCMIEVLETCFDSNIFKTLPTFDIEYLFLQLRAKSISPIVTPIITCPYTEEKIKIEIDLNEINVIFDTNHTKILNLGNNITLIMKYPSIDTLMKTTTISEESIYDIALSCMESIQTTDELVECVTHPKKELEEFLNHLTSDQFSQITNFFKSIPKIEKEITYITSDGEKRTIILQGIKDFFV